MVANIKSMFYHGEQPWHKLGKEVDHVLTSAEAIDAAGLNWTVEKTPLFLPNRVECPGAFANVKSDDQTILGVVGAQYSVLQNVQAFSIADAIVGEKAAMYHTAGALGKGEKVWMLLKMPGFIRTIGEDITEKYLLVSNSHDGTSAVQIMFTPIRVVCQNTLNEALRSGANKVSIRHTSGLNQKVQVEQVRKTLGIATKYFDIFETLSQKMVETKFDSKTLLTFAQASGVVPTEKEGEDTSTRAKNIMEEISALLENGRGTDIPGVKGSVWGAYNAITEYVDFGRGADAGRRADSLLYGSGAKIKQAAFDTALELVGVQS